MAIGFQCDKCKGWFKGEAFATLETHPLIEIQGYDESDDWVLCKNCAKHIINNCINKKECE